MDYLKEDISFKEKFNPKESKHILSALLIFFIALAIPVTVLITINNRDLRSKAAENKQAEKVLEDHQIPALLATEQLNAAGRGLKTDIKRKDKVIEGITPLLEKRKADLEYLFEKDPQSAPAVLLDNDALSALGTLKNKKIEEKVTLTGTYNFSHHHEGSDFKKSTFQPQIIVGTDTIDLYSNGKLPYVKPGEKISITGYQLDKKLFIKAQTSDEVVQIKTVAADKVLGLATGPLTTAIIVANFADSTQSIDMNGMKAVFEASSGYNVVNYFKEASYGKLDLVPSYFGPYKLSSNTSDCVTGAGINELMNLANPDINYTQFRRVIYVFNCSYGGTAGGAEHDVVNTLDGPAYNFNSILIGFPADNYNLYSPYPYTHELAHELGNSHGAFWDCPPAAKGFAPPTRFYDDYTCRSGEYGDYWDVLGNKMVHLNPYHKNNPGFFDAGKLVNVTSSGTYTLAPYETGGTGILALNIPRPGSNTSFTVEYRQLIGFDQRLYNPASCPVCNIANGASIRLAGYGDWGGGGGSDTNVIDSTPGSIKVLGLWHDEDSNDGAWLPGQTFTDPETGIAIGILSVDSSGLKVQVSVPSQTCTHNPGTYTIANPNQSGQPGQTVNYSINFKNNDSAGCNPDKFRVFPESTWLSRGAPVSVRFYQFKASPDVFTLAPGESKNITLSITIPTNATASIYPYQASGMYIVSNALGGSSVTVGNFSLQVTSSAADTVPPTAPTNITAVAGAKTVDLAWTGATDNVGVVGYQIILNGSLIWWLDSPNFHFATSPNSTHTFTIQAYDAQGNLSPVATKVVTTPSQTDTQPPTAPEVISATATDHSVTLNWGISTDDKKVVGYYIQGGGKDAYVPPTTHSVNIDYLNTNSKYLFRIYAYDADGNYSDSFKYTSWYRVNTANEGQIAPDAPFTFYSPSGTKNGINLSWSAVPNVANYKIYRFGDYLTTVTGTSYTDPDLGSGYSIVAVDNNGNESPPLPKYALTWSVYLTAVVGGGSTGYVWNSLYGGASSTDTIAPTITSSGLSNNQTVSGQINVDTTASDDGSVKVILLYVDGESYAYTPINPTSPYRFTWDTTKTFNGKHWIYTMAFDEGGNYRSSEIITVNVDNPENNIPSPTPTLTPTPTPTVTPTLSPSPSSTPGDNQQPTIAITNPLDGALVVKNTAITITANATDNVGVTKVDFAVGNTKCSDTIAPYTCKWKTGGKPGASYVITARAYDAAGNNTLTTITVKSK